MKIANTPIVQIDNDLWVKREDLIPFSFGGNKVRKAALFFEDFDKGSYDCVVTYGSSSSNHCRVIANIAASRGILCYIVSPTETLKETYNRKLIELFGASFIFAPLNKVHETLESTIKKLREEGHKPYFIQGGGHGNIGTQAYINCYQEIVEWEKANNLYFDYIFFASGTGTTQAGLVCGQILAKDNNRRIIGISIARSKERGANVIKESIMEYLGSEICEKECNDKIVFLDDYIEGGYGKQSQSIKDIIKFAMEKYGLPLDETYTGKAFFGMNDYLKKNNIANKKVLFIHTGGTPLFFDSIK